MPPSVGLTQLEGEAATSAAEAAFGAPTVLVNNAATRHWAPLEELSRAAWDREIATNLGLMPMPACNGEITTTLEQIHFKRAQRSIGGAFVEGREHLRAAFPDAV